MIFSLTNIKIKFSGLFNKDYYLDSYPDVKKAGVNPFMHFMKYGWREGRNPSVDFDTNFYLGMYSDVKSSGINPLVHYVQHGKMEGRLAKSSCAIATKNQFVSNETPIIPQWVIDEMKVLGKELDPILYPSDNLLARYTYYQFAIDSLPGEIYYEILSKCSTNVYAYCFALPWLKRGGADFVALRHIEFAQSTSHGKILVLLTEPGDSPWLSRLSSEVDVIDISKYVWKISHHDLVLVIARLLIQLEIAIIHIINSRHVWDVLKFYPRAITNKSEVFASLYCDDYDLNGIPVGYARDYLPICHTNITNIFCDSYFFPALLCKTYGFKRELFKVLYSPIDADCFVQRSTTVKKQVLWAGRLDRQKRPDILLDIAKSLIDVEFLVYGTPMLEGINGVINELEYLPNVKMFGAFDGVQALPFEQCSLFLYTSQWDGIPTIVIAAALANIPVVASNVGGISEIISSERGYLVNNIEDVSEYVKAIQCILDNPVQATAKANLAMEYAKTYHSNEHFWHDLKLINKYSA